MPNNIRLANLNDVANGVTYQFGVPASVPQPDCRPWRAAAPITPISPPRRPQYPTPSHLDATSTPLAGPTLPPDWPYAPLQPIAADITFTNDRAPRGPLTTLMAIQNDRLHTTRRQSLTCTTCTGNPTGAARRHRSSLLQRRLTLITLRRNHQINTWNLIDGYLRVEYRDAAGAYHPVTAEWLQLGFARGTTPPTAPGTNPVNPNAILILQEPADRNGNGVIDHTGAGPSCSKVERSMDLHQGQAPRGHERLGLRRLPWYGDSKAS